uniref:dipeptidase n=1 Tax=uncultured Altererythrobacter sp. TaxID=500840 RepID=UPI00262E8BF2|nr:dipeptidase [uncultured Altererythrobacter sp.]
MRSVSMITAAALLSLPSVALAQSAEEIAAAALEAAPIMDGHNDVPIQLRARFANQINDFDFSDTTGTAQEQPARSAMHTDIARLRQGKVGTQYWSVYVPASLDEPEAVQMTIEQIDVTKRLIAANPDDLQLALTADEIEAALAEGKIASLMGMEGGHSIGSSLAVLRQMYDLGARYMTLTHSRNVPWADSATDEPEHNGLTDFGRDLIREMNRIGMQVDLSHVSEKVMHDVLDIAQAPVIFSHSSARSMNGHARNVPDSVLQRLPANGGVIMITFVPGFLSEPARQWNANRAAERARLEALWLGQPAQVEQGMRLWDDANPLPQSSIREVADHIDHVRAVAGIDTIGIGGDYDGIPFAPPGLEDVTGYPALFTELARRGYSQEDLEKISMRNAMRALRAAEVFAASQVGQPPVETLIERAE